MGDILKGSPLVSDARPTSHSVSTAEPVAAGTAVANTTGTSYLSEFDLIESKYSITGAVLDKIIPLRKNYSEMYGKTWSRTSGAGCVGYCESSYGTDTSFGIKVAATFSGISLYSSKYVYKFGIFDSYNNQLGRSKEIFVERNGVYTFYVDPIRRMSTGFYKSSLKFKWYYKTKKGSEWTLSNDITVPLYNFPLKPTSPWSNKKGERNNPWTDVLDLLWGKSIDNPENYKLRYQTTTARISKAVTYIVNSKLGLVYDNDGGGSTRFGSGKYDLTDFLKCLNGTSTTNLSRNKRVINCTDCARAVTTFANLLGCYLFNVVFGGTGGFHCNKVMTLGASKWDYPFSDRYGGTEGGFACHEINMVGTYKYTSNIYDACLKVNKNVIKNGQDSNRSSLLPENTRYSSQTDYPRIRTKDDYPYISANDDQYYIEWLVYNDRKDFIKAKLYSNRGTIDIE